MQAWFPCEKSTGATSSNNICLSLLKVKWTNQHKKLIQKWNQTEQDINIFVAMFIMFKGVSDTPFSDPIEAIMAMFLMSLGDFGDVYDSFSSTPYVKLGHVRTMCLNVQCTCVPSLQHTCLCGLLHPIQCKIIHVMI